jgi:putative endonuclease
MTKARQTLGQRGERLALAHLRQQGYTIVTTNWRCAHGELDIIARQNDTVVFVEVRTGCAETTEAAFESVNPRKQGKLADLAHLFLAEHGIETAAWRIDVIGVAIRRSGTPLIEQVENALGW